MKNVIKKLFMFTSILGVAVMMAACSSCNSKKPASGDTEYYKTYEEADVTKVTAKMYTHSTAGGEAKIGHIKFYETDSGLKMAVDLKDLRPGVEYNVVVYGSSNCNAQGKMCQMDKMSLNLPKLKAGDSRKLEESFVIRGLTAGQLQNAMITLQRDGGYKAAWGKLESSMMF